MKMFFVVLFFVFSFSVFLYPIPYTLYPVIRAAERPSIIFTSQANNYYPSNYAGKALPTPRTNVSVAAEVLQNNKLLDISSADFTWSVDDKVMKRGIGAKETTFQITKTPGDSHFVYLSVKLKDNTIAESSLRIPVAPQKIVIEHGLLNLAALALPNFASAKLERVNVGEKIQLRAIPYFFNVRSLDDMLFFWKVNGEQKASGNNNQLAITFGAPQTAADKTATVDLAAQNKNDSLESAKTALKMSIK